MQVDLEASEIKILRMLIDMEYDWATDDDSEEVSKTIPDEATRLEKIAHLRSENQLYVQELEALRNKLVLPDQVATLRLPT